LRRLEYKVTGLSTTIPILTYQHIFVEELKLKIKTETKQVKESK
jgi:hypothetical protein